MALAAVLYCTGFPRTRVRGNCFEEHVLSFPQKRELGERFAFVVDTFSAATDLNVHSLGNFFCVLPDTLLIRLTPPSTTVRTVYSAVFFTVCGNLEVTNNCRKAAFEYRLCSVHAVEIYTVWKNSVFLQNKLYVHTVYAIKIQRTEQICYLLYFFWNTGFEHLFCTRCIHTNYYSCFCSVEFSDWGLNL
jgi:hypothetical protein